VADAGPDRPAPVARVAGLPLGVLAGLRCAATAAVIEEILDLDDWLAVEGAALADELYGPVGSAAPELRPRLVGLRRALHGGRAPARAEWDPVVAAAVPPGTAARVDRWVERAAGRRRLAATLPDRLADDTAGAVEAVRSAVADPGFRRALIRSSPTLDAAVERWLSGGGPPRRQVLLRLARYLARAATKTSPYGTLTTSGPTRWGPAGSLLGPVRPGPPVTLLELDGLLLAGILRHLLGRPEVAAALPLRVTPGAAVAAGSLALLGPAPVEPVVTVGCTDAVRACLDAAAGGAARAEVVSALVAGGADGSRAGAYVDRLVGLGVLEVGPPVPAGSPAPLLALADRAAAAGGGAAGLAGPLRRLHAELSRPVPLADAAGQRRRQRALGDAAAAVAAAAGLTGAAEVARHRPEVVAHEHALAAVPVTDCGWPAWRPVLADLAALRRWSAVHDPALPLRLVLGDWVAARFGPGARLPFVLLHRAVRQEVAGPPPDPLGAELARWLDPTGSVPAAALAASAAAVPRLAELGALRRAAAEPLAAAPDPDGVVRVDPAALRPDRWPAWVADPGPAACYVQPVAGGVVLNAMTVGHGRGRSRLRHLAGLAGLAWPADGTEPSEQSEPPEQSEPSAPGGHPCGAEAVEISGAFGTALNDRAPATRREIEYPGTASTRPPADRIPLGALVAEHDERTGLVRLRDRPAGVPVRPVHLGLLVEALLPAAARLLVQLAGSTVLPPGWAEPVSPRPAPDPAGVAHLPRVQVRHVTLHRARWLVRAATLGRGPGETDAEHLLRLAGWRRRHGIPARAFLHAGGPAAATGGAFDKTRKPLYVDWESGPLAATAERYLRGAAELVVVEEALPDPAGGGCADRTVELLVDVPGGGCGG